VWDRLRKQIDLERRQLHLLLEKYQALLRKCAVTSPNDIELSALAAMLHAFYNGIETIFKRTAAELGDPLPAGESWHKELLDAMAQATRQRSPVLSPELQARLKEYMEFRHMFRHAYTFELQWNKMRTLILGCEETLKLVEGELDHFFKTESAGDP